MLEASDFDMVSVSESTHEIGKWRCTMTKNINFLEKITVTAVGDSKEAAVQRAREIMRSALSEV